MPADRDRRTAPSPAPLLASSPASSPAPSPAPSPASSLAPPTSRALLQLVLSTATVEDFLDELVVLAGGVNPVVAGCGITVRRGPHVLSIAVSNALAGEVDEVQYGLGQGPCLSALETGRAVSVEDVSTEQRFGGYPARALASGVLSSYSVPLTVGGTTVGALNSYSRTVHSFTRVVRDQLLGFGGQAEVALALSLRAAAQTGVAEQLHAAVDSRSTIDQALGIIMVDKRCDAEEAFAVLRATSQSRRRTIGEIAVELITTTTGKLPRTRSSED